MLSLIQDIGAMSLRKNKGFCSGTVYTRRASWPRRHLHKQVADLVLRATLTPNYALGCKPVLLMNTSTWR
jgi:cation diffusion facilitator CzcD-associated flavoprotein CzcO